MTFTKMAEYEVDEVVIERIVSEIKESGKNFDAAHRKAKEQLDLFDMMMMEYFYYEIYEEVQKRLSL